KSEIRISKSETRCVRRGQRTKRLRLNYRFPRLSPCQGERMKVRGSNDLGRGQSSPSPSPLRKARRPKVPLITQQSPHKDERVEGSSDSNRRCLRANRRRRGDRRVLDYWPARDDRWENNRGITCCRRRRSRNRERKFYWPRCDHRRATAGCFVFAGKKNES